MQIEHIKELPELTMIDYETAVINRLTFVQLTREVNNDRSQKTRTLLCNVDICNIMHTPLSMLETLLKNTTQELIDFKDTSDVNDILSEVLTGSVDTKDRDNIILRYKILKRLVGLKVAEKKVAETNSKIAEIDSMIEKAKETKMSELSIDELITLKESLIK